MIKQMKYFQAVVRCRSFTEAAEECFISQSAISQQVQALENELGVRLLKRQNRRFTLTPAGECFYRKSLVLINDFERLCRETIRIGDGGHTLKIGYLSHYQGRELSRAVADFSAQQPDISMRITSGTHEELYEELRTGKIDIAFSDLRRSPSEQYVNIPLAKSFFFAAIPIVNPLVQLDALTMDDLKNTPCVAVASKAQETHEENFYREYLGIHGEILFAESAEAAHLMVVSGKGYGLVDFTARPEHRNSVAFIPIVGNGEPLYREYYVFWRKERTEPQIEAFAELLKRQFDKPGEDNSAQEGS